MGNKRKECVKMEESEKMVIRNYLSNEIDSLMEAVESEMEKIGSEEDKSIEFVMNDYRLLKSYVNVFKFFIDCEY